MEFQNTRIRLKGVLAFLLLLVLQAFSVVSAQCPVLVGGSDFYDKSHSDTIWAGDLNLIETVGPTGSKFSSGVDFADSAQAFMQEDLNVYAVTTNPHLLDSTYVDVDKNMYAVHIAHDKTAAVGANTKLFSYKVGGIEKGSDFKITFTLWCLNDTKYGLGAEEDPTDYRWAIEAGIDLDQYGASSCKVKESYKLGPGKSVEVTLEGTLADNLDYIKLDLATGYNFMYGMTLGISDLRVYGCYKPHVKSSQGIEICRGEQALISLDKEYNASSYKWFKSANGGPFTAVGSGKNVYEQIKDEKAAYFCLVNGVNSDTININTIVCCVDANNNPMSRMDVFYDDFGYFDDLRSYTDAFGNSKTQPATYAPERADVTFDLSATGMKFDASGQINDGTYGVVVPSPTGYYQDISGNSRATWMSGVSSDHSSLITGKAGGGALFMNITENFTGVIFSRQIDGLCTDKNIYFETYIANMSGGTDPEVTINIKDATSGKVLATDKAVATKDAGWIRVHIDELQVSASSIILEIESTGGAGDMSGQFWRNGNDLIIDDIRFMVCSPPNVDIYSNLESFASDTTICANTDFEMGTQVSDLLSSFFKNQQNYLYQHSVDGKVWENMGDITDKPTYTFNTEIYPADTNHFRVVVATPEALKKFVENPSDADYDDKCRNYSISKSFKIIRAGAIDMGKDMELSECGGLELTMNGSNDGTLVRWGWEDAAGNVLVATTTDEAAKAYVYKVTDDADFTFIGYNAEGCVGKRKFSVTKKNTVEFTLDTTMLCSQTNVKASVTPATAEFKWIYGGVELAETGSSVELDTSNAEATLKAVASAAGYCESDTVDVDVKFRNKPNPPRTIKTEDFEQVKPNSSYPYVSMVKMSGDIQWSATEDGPWVADEPKQSLESPGVFHYYVRAIEKGCPSDPIMLTLTINEIPVPKVRNDTVCVGTKIDLTKYIVESDPDYALIWYNTEDGTGTEKPQSYTATMGGMVLDYWVSQKDKKAESEKAHIQVVVPNIAKPKVPAAEVTYCLNDDAEELTATVSANPRAYIYADDEVEWRIGDEVVTNLVPSTATPGLTEYSVYGKLTHPTTLNGDAVCYSDPVSVSVEVVATPEPTSGTNPEFTVTYMKSEGNVSTGFADVYTASAAKVAVTAGPDYSLVWYDADGNKLPSAPTPPYIEDQEEDLVYNYSVSQIDANGCESEKVPVVVYVNATPAPIVRDTVICSGETFSLADKVTSNGAGFQLLWYESETDNTPDVAAPALTVTKPGEYTYYVSQKSPEGAESRKVAMTVTIVGVLEPKVLVEDVTYCRNATADPISVMATSNVDAANFYMADADLVWKSEGVTPVAATTVPETNVATSSVYTYAVNQVYTIPSSGAVCQGNPVSVTVNVTVVDVPGGTHIVNYLKTDGAENNGTFKNLMDQSDNKVAVALPGNTLKWYDEAKNPLAAVPTPPYDASLQGDAEFTYYVSQIDANGCESELVPVVATVSSTPMPTTTPVAYCEGDDAVAPLTAQITLVGNGDTESDYSLVWYSENPNNLATEAEKAALALASAPTPSIKVSNGETFQVYTYYVAQKRTNADGKEVVSRAATLVDTVYARPILTVDNPAPVCKPTTVDLSNNNLWTVKAAKIYAKAWFDNSMASAVDNPYAVAESGDYYVQASFDVRGKECASELAKITVEVDYIDDLAIDGPVTTCPGTSVELKATTSAIYPTNASYTWTSDQTGENETVATASFSTAELPGPAGRTYSYQLSATAGACHVNAAAKHVITIGDGPIVGTVTFDEADNNGTKVFNASANGVVFYSCGNDVTISTDLTATENDFVWTLNGTPVGTGATIKVTPGAGTSVYKLTYTNSCPTGFDVSVVNIPVSVSPTNTAYNICEGEDFTAELNVACAENTYKTTWFKDGVVVEGETNKVLSFTPATADKNGVYTYEVTNRGCSVKGEIANGNPLKVRPYIKATAQPLYVARRDSMLSIPLNITTPAGTDPSSIQWMESGVEFASNVNPLQLKVTADHNFLVKLSDDDYCDASVEVEVKADARLKLKLSLDDQMCAGEKRDLIIDTTGTGSFVYPTAAGLEVTEITDNGERLYTAGWTLNADGMLHMTVNPAANATYVVRFFYRKGEGTDEQIVSVTNKIAVLEPVNLVAPEVMAICGDGESEMDLALKTVYPSGVDLTWEDDPTIISSLGTSVITIVPKFEGADGENSYLKTYTVHGKYSICSEVVVPVQVRVDRPLEGGIIAPDVICEGFSATIDASAYNATTYEWTSDNDSTVNGSTSASILVKPAYTSLYELNMTRGACSASDEFSLAVSENPTIVSVDSLYYNKRDIIASNGNSPYMYWLDGGKDSASVNSLMANIAYGKHTAHVIDAAGCTAELDFVVTAPQIKIPILISPNGDDVNESFTTDVIQDAFPEAVIRVYDRWGKLLVTYKGSDPGWDGMYQGHPMPSSDYWYEIEVKELKKTFTGHFTLMRQ